MKHVFILMVLLGMSLCLPAQTLTITDGETGEPVELVSIGSENPPAFTSTNAKGQADLRTLRGAEVIQIRSLGYYSQTLSYDDLEAAGFVLKLLPSGVGMDEVVVSATRWNQIARDVPSKVMAINPREVSLQNPQTAADLLSLSGKVFMQKSQQGGGSPMIRGFATNRLLYTVDGVRMNTAIFRGGNLQNVISLDPFAMEKTEVMFGPGSIIYGSDAIGGAMSFQTLTPQLSLEEKPLVKGKAVARYSSANNEKTGHFDINVGWKRWALVSSLTSTDYGDLRMGSRGPEEYLRPFYVQRQDSTDIVVTNDDPRVQRPTGYSQINMMQKVRFKPNDHWDLQYGLHYSETSPYSRYDRHLRTRNGLPRYGEWSYGPQKWMMNNLNVSHSRSTVLYDQVSLRLAWQFFEESRISRNFNEDIREIRTEKVDALSGNLDFSKSLGRHQIYYGLEAIHNIVESTGIDENIAEGTKNTGPARYPQATWSSYAVYAMDQIRASEKLTLQAGGRYNRFLLDAAFDTRFFPFPFTEAKLNKGALTGSVGAVYRPATSTVIRLNAASAFRAPNVDDIGKVFDSEPGAVVIPNPDLQAEYAWNADLGLAQVLGKRVKIDLTGYYTILENALVRRNFSLNGSDSIVYAGELSQVQAIQNAARANVFGIQAGIEIKLPGGWGFDSDINFQKGEEELDDGSVSPSRHAAPWFGLTKITYNLQKLYLQVYASYSGARKFEDMPVDEKGKTEIYATDENGNPWSPGWATVNFKAMYKFGDFYSVSGGLENIADVRYRPYSSGIVAPGRNFILSFRAAF